MLKAGLTFLVIAMLQSLLRRYPLLSGYVAVFPVVTFLSLAVLAAERSGAGDVSRFLTGALSGVVITALALGLMIFCVRAGVSVAWSVFLGMVLWFLLALGLARV